jgi:hypothetical protein
VLAQKDRQIPSMAMVIMLAFMFWVFVAHTIFALFFGLQPITSSTADMLISAPGVKMLIVGGTIGGGMAAVLFGLTVVSLPLLLDREVDFITAMITSFNVVLVNLVPMLVWAALIAGLLFLGHVAHVSWPICGSACSGPCDMAFVPAGSALNLNAAMRLAGAGHSARGRAIYTKKGSGSCPQQRVVV